MPKQIELVCSECGNKFNRPLKEHKRSLKLDRKEFCGRVCQGKAGNNLGDFEGRPNPAYLIAGARRDEFTGFRYYTRKAKARYSESNITLEYLKKLWQAQEGKCAYTKIPIVLRNDTYLQYKQQNLDYKAYRMASLDRIDSTKPYDVGNVQFVSLSINYMKASMTDTDTKEFLNLITNKPQTLNQDYEI